MMKRIITAVLILTMVAIIVFGVFRLMGQSPMDSEVGAASEIAKVSRWMEQMSIDDKVGQMIIMTNDEQSVTDEFKEELLEVRPGGYILMVPNITTYTRTKRMLEEFDGISRHEYGIEDLPMILAVDEEGGNVQRLLYVEDKEATNVPYMYEIGKINDNELAYKVGKVIGEEVRSLGLNLTFAPSVDIITNSNNTVIGKRSFGENKEIVAKMAMSVAAGIESVGVGTAYKHFPGHGDTAIDSHIDLPVLNKDWDELEDVELYPFQEAIDNGAEMIMVGHIAVGGRDIPASLDKDAISSILRKRMGFDGLIVTDALNMGAIINNYTSEEIAVAAVKAGEDLLLMPVDARVAKKAILDAIETGEITEERIDESVRRILNYKVKHLSNFTPFSEESFGSDEHNKVIQGAKNRI